MSTHAISRRYLLVPVFFVFAALLATWPAAAAEPIGEMTPVASAQATTIGTPPPIFLSGCLIGTLCCLEEWQPGSPCQPWERLAMCCDSYCGNCHGKAFCHNLDPDPCQT